jgi:hypothetical protein
MKRSWLYFVVIAFGFYTLLVLLQGPASPTQLLSSLAIGWWHFLRTNVPELTINWSLIGMALLCSVIVLGLGHWLLTTTYRPLGRSGPHRRAWRWRWTLIAFAGLWLLFGVCLGAVGVFQHTSWLLGEQRPWYQPRVNLHMEFRIANADIQQLLSNNDGQLLQTRADFLGAANSSGGRSFQPWPALFDIIFYADPTNYVETYVLVPREESWPNADHFALSTPPTRFEVIPLSRLRATLAELDSRFAKRSE